MVLGLVAEKSGLVILLAVDRPSPRLKVTFVPVVEVNGAARVIMIAFDLLFVLSIDQPVVVNPPAPEVLIEPSTKVAKLSLKLVGAVQLSPMIGSLEQKWMTIAPRFCPAVAVVNPTV